MKSEKLIVNIETHVQEIDNVLYTISGEKIPPGVYLVEETQQLTLITKSSEPSLSPSA